MTDLTLKHLNKTETVKLRLDELIRRDRLFFLAADDVEEMNKLQIEYYSSIQINPIRFRLSWMEDADADLDYRHTAAQCLAAREPIKDIKSFRRLLDFYCGTPTGSLRIEASKAFIARQDISNRLDDLRADYSDSDLLDELLSDSGQADTQKDVASTSTPEEPSKWIIVHRYRKSDGKDDKERDAFAKALGEPKSISGPGSVDDVDEMFSALYEEAPWMREPLKNMWSEARSNAADGNPFGFSPVLLYGGAGLGKTHLARMLSTMSGCPSVTLQGGNMSAAFDISGTERTWRSASPGVCVRAIHDQEIANPMVIFDEIDKTPKNSSGGDPQLALLPLLQADTAESYRCPYVQGVVDLSYVNWIACANDVSALPRPLIDRFAVFEIKPPKGEILMHFIERQFEKYDVSHAKMLEMKLAIEAGKMSLRGLSKLKERLAAYANRPLYN